ncbi:MAG: MerR family transcriptional regulator [Gammaproteobacteria bacterium]|nr:MerR family transcriptional regulator [Gammaproteobacteria bacterium]
MNGQHNISDVSRIAGIPKDLLRMWERRYGYPTPARDDNGDRVYTDEQLSKLLVIRQLLDQGKRPGKLMGLDIRELRSLVEVPKVEFAEGSLIERLKTGDAGELRDWFKNQLEVHGLRGFIHKVMAPALQVVGNAWTNDEITIYEEHLVTQILKELVRQALSETIRDQTDPRIMLTTVPGEQHSLGLLMVEALLRLGGAEVISFGTEMPFKEIREAAERHSVQVVGLSFSGSFKTDDALVMLSGLRPMIDPAIEIWVGGSAFAAKPAMPHGVILLENLLAVEITLGRWRQSALS